MGMSQSVQFAAGRGPSWPAVRKLLASRKFPLQVRMIDGELAFPDEEPGENWRELRLATQEGMAITVKRATDLVELVIWGNAEAGLIQARNALTWAFAESGQGLIPTAEGDQTSAEYLVHADMPEVIREA
jgi:hypothetical protein